MESLQGKFLVASPQLLDPNFFHTVVLVVQHDENGAMGLVVNRPLDIRLAEAWEEAGEGKCEAEGTLYQGGPVDGPLMALHGDATLAEIEIMAGVNFCNGKASLEQLVLNNDRPMKFFVGYAGWTKGQLEAEMEEGGWMATEATAEQVFGEEEELWRKLLRAINRQTSLAWVDPKIMPDDPSLN
jgi:putative transcriptional regulator